MKSPLPCHRFVVNEESNKRETKKKIIQNNKNDNIEKIRKIKFDEKFIESVGEKDLNDIFMQIKMLNEELKYYEEITGKRCIFQRDVRHIILYYFSSYYISCYFIYFFLYLSYLIIFISYFIILYDMI